MVRHPRGAFKRAAVLQISGDARGAKSVVADARGDASGFGGGRCSFIVIAAQNYAAAAWGERGDMSANHLRALPLLGSMSSLQAYRHCEQ